MGRNSIKVHVRLHPSSHEFSVPEDVLVKDLKVMIAEKLKIPIEIQQISFQKIEINDDFELSFYFVHDNDVLELTTPQFTEVLSNSRWQKAPLDIICEHYGINVPGLQPGSSACSSSGGSQTGGLPTKEWCSSILHFIVERIITFTYVDIVHGPIINYLQNSNPEEQGPLIACANVFFQSITVRQGAEVLTGKWENYAPTQVILGNYIRYEILKGDTSPERIRALAVEATENMKNLAQVAVPEHYIAVMPGRHLLGLLYDAFLRNVTSIIYLMLEDLSPTVDDPCPFAAKIKAWHKTFFREIGDAIWACVFGHVVNHMLARMILMPKLTAMEQDKNVAGASKFLVQILLRIYYDSITTPTK